MIKSPKYSQNENSNSREGLNHFFMDSIKELYCAEKTIALYFNRIKDQIQSRKLKNILQNHYKIHLNHLERLEKIFKLQEEKPDSKDCESIMKKPIPSLPTTSEVSSPMIYLPLDILASILSFGMYQLRA